MLLGFRRRCSTLGGIPQVFSAVSRISPQGSRILPQCILDSVNDILFRTNQTPFASFQDALNDVNRATVTTATTEGRAPPPTSGDEATDTAP